MSNETDTPAERLQKELDDDTFGTNSLVAKDDLRAVLEVYAAAIRQARRDGANRLLAVMRVAPKAFSVFCPVVEVYFPTEAEARKHIESEIDRILTETEQK